MRHVRKATAVLVRRRTVDEVLLIEHPLDGGGVMLQLPAGTVEPDEEPEVAVLRELVEETGVAGAIRSLAGVLDGLEATTHWLDMDHLDRFGARPTGRRVVEQGKVVTAAGVSSGIDMGLVLSAKIAGPEVAQAIQLGIEYDPQPPFDSGSIDKAPAEIVELVRAVAAART